MSIKVTVSLVAFGLATRNILTESLHVILILHPLCNHICEMIIWHSRLSNIPPVFLVGMAIRSIRVNIFLVVWLVTTKNIRMGCLPRLLVTKFIPLIFGVGNWNYINVVLASPLIKTVTLHCILWAYFMKIPQMVAEVLAKLPTLKSCLMSSVIHLVRRESCCVPLICECADILLRVLTVSRMACRLQHPPLVFFDLLMGRSWFRRGYKAGTWHSELWILPRMYSWCKMSLHLEIYFVF